MTRTTLGLCAIALLSALLWGCGRGPDSLAATNKALETKLIKMQADLADVSAKVLELDQRLANEQARTRMVEAERDSLATRLKSRTDERDAAHQQFDALVKSLESALGQAKAARASLGHEQLPMPKAALSAVKSAMSGF